MRALEPLGEAECMDLLGTSKYGRLVYNSRYGLVARPAAYVLREGSIIFHAWDPVTGEDLRTGIANTEFRVCFEADHFDMDAREGWSVLVQGAAHHLDTEDERAVLMSDAPEPWLGTGEPGPYIQVTPVNVWVQHIHAA